MKTHAILVDLDGTLIETAGANYHAYAQSLAEVGLSISRQEFDARAAGRNWKQFLPEMLKQAGIDADPARLANRSPATTGPSSLISDQVREQIQLISHLVGDFGRRLPQQSTLLGDE